VSASLSVAPANRPRRERSKAVLLNRPDSLAWIAQVVVFAALVTAGDLLLSTRLGLLANPILYDGLTYLVESEHGPAWQLIRPSAQNGVPSWEAYPVSTPLIDAVPALGLFRKHAPVWNMLLSFSFAELGVGDWQAYTARFWPTALLLLLVYKVVRDHSTPTLAWVAVLATSMTPVVSVSIRSATYERFISQNVDFGREWFRADLRPDYPFAVAMLWTTYVLLAWLKRPSPALAVLLGVLSALSVLTKPSVFPAILVILAMAGLFGLVARRQAVVGHLRQVAIAMGVGLVLLIPWIASDALGVIVEYITVNTTEMRPLWIRSPTAFTSPLGRVQSYLGFADSLMGSEVWLVLVVGAALTLRLWRTRSGLSISMLGLLWVGLVALVLTLTLPGVQPSLGLLAILALWLASWSAISQYAVVGLRRFGVREGLVATFACAYVLALGGLAWYAYVSWPAYGRDVGPKNRETTDRIAQDVSRIMKPDEILIAVETWGFPMSIARHMDPFPRLFMTDGMFLLSRDGLTPDAMADQVLRDCSECSIVVTLDTDTVQDAPHLATSPVTLPYLDAFARWVKSPASSYHLARAYPISADPFTSLSADEDGRYTPSLLLFIRRTAGGLAELGFDDARDGILFGSGWVRPEGANGERFRWAGDQAELVLSPLDKHTLSIDVEPGPSLDGAPLELSVVGPDGASRRLPAMTARRTVTLEVPGPADRKRTVRLRVENAGQREPVDGQILSFRVFDAAWSADEGLYRPGVLLGLNAAVDIGPPEDRRVMEATGAWPVDGIFTAFGWHAAEQYQSNVFRWATSDVEIVVTRPSGRRTELEMELEPGPGVGLKPFDLQVVDANGDAIRTVRVPGRDKIKVPLPIQPGADVQTFRLRVVGGGQPTPNDTRILNFRAFALRWADSTDEQAVARLQQLTKAPDIVPEAGLRELATNRLPASGLLIGQGWYPLETFEGSHFRWAANDVELVATRPTGESRELELDLEPGPGVGSGPFYLEIVDEAGLSVGTLHVPGRGVVKIPLTVPRGNDIQRYRLRVQGGGQPTPNDPRVLNFRVFSIRWAVAVDAAKLAQLRKLNGPQDIVPEAGLRELAANRLPVDGLLIGDGWYPFEIFGGAQFRWAATDVEIVVSQPSGERREIELDLEPGSGVGSKPFELQIVNESGSQVGSALVQGRQIVKLSLPIQRGSETQTFRLRVQGGGLPTPNDPRALNFRVFSIRWAAP
jgi:hypothetical protein